MKKRAFTLVELMIAIACLAALLGPIYLLLRSGTQSSLKGMKRLETTLEARKVLKQVYSDLKLSCFSMPEDGYYDFSNTITVLGTPPKNTYKFMSFPIHQDYSNIFSNQTTGINFRKVSHITYEILESDDSLNPYYRLVRTEEFEGQTRTTVLSKQVNFFEIKPIVMKASDKYQFYHLITLQLIDSTHPSLVKDKVAGTKLDELDKDVILADYFDIVYPEYFHAAWNQTKFGPNWHTLIEEN
jgi:prepilin-type N-terminal cleavage/methylation domain-containing protein